MVINRNLPRRPRLHPAADAALNKLLSILSRKATLWACLFLFLGVPQKVVAQELDFDEQRLKAYELALDLQPKEALALTGQESDVTSTYIASLAEATELLVTEDFTLFSTYEERFQQRLDRKLKGSARAYQYLQAEIRLHWAFVYLKFGHELDAALQLRQAFQVAMECRSKYPDYLPIRKTAGLLEIIIGSVPEKYNWVLHLLNMRGSVSAGLNDLATVAGSDSPLAREGQLLLSLANGYVLGRPEEALDILQNYLNDHPENRLGLFFAAGLALKNGRNEAALQFLETLKNTASDTPLYYADYLRGEALLHKADYVNSVAAYRWFIQHQRGQNYIKDAWYKIGLCYWLNGNENDAYEAFGEARKQGKEDTEADKSAARSLSSGQLPNIKLSRVRYFTDGGYYSEAAQVLDAITSMDLPERRDQVEYYYRKARLAHQAGKPEAMAFYMETIRMTGQENWYFAPNACLQLGYLYVAENKLKEAEEYFQRALSYRRHEYKNSIDAKARLALAQISRM